MRKIILVISAILLLSSISEVLAAETSLPYNASMVYNVTVNKIEVYNSTTLQWVTVTSTATTFNIASATAASAAVGNMISGVTLPNGTYTRLKWEVSSTFGIKACETGAGRCTNGTGAALATHTFSAVGALTYATASTTTNIIDFTAAGACPADNLPTIDYTCAATSLAGDAAITSFVIGAGSSAKTVNVIFDINNVMKHYTVNHFGVSPEMIQPGEPSVSMTFE